MRNCPVCTSNIRSVIMEQNFTIPDQWMIPHELILYRCSSCGVAYLDATQANQTVYDEYYRSGQFNFVGEQDPASTKRLEALGGTIKAICDPRSRILDVGGEDGHLQKILVTQGFTHVETCGPNVDVEGHFDLIVMSHLIEHIYDMDGFFARFRTHLKPYTRLVVEIPVWSKYPEVEEGWRAYDFNLVHINKFRRSDLSQMLSRYHFVCDETQDLPYFRRFECFRYRGHYTGESDYPVVVWGLSDEVLSLIGKWNVVQYVDKSSVYRGCTIKGVPIKDHVDSRAPIVIGAIHSRDAIRAEIKEAGLSNEVIFI